MKGGNVMMEKRKYWYAIVDEPLDNEWGFGSFDLREARRMLYEINDSDEANGFLRGARIAVIDGGFDYNGNPTRDPICIRQLEEGDI